MKEDDLIRLYNRIKPEPKQIKIVMRHAEKAYKCQCSKKRLMITVYRIISAAALIFVLTGICFLAVWITGNGHSLFRPMQSEKEKYATLSSWTETVTSETEDKTEELPEYLQESGIKVKIWEVCYYISEQGILCEERQEKSYELDVYAGIETKLLTWGKSLYYSTNKDGVT